MGRSKGSKSKPKPGYHGENIASLFRTASASNLAGPSLPPSGQLQDKSAPRQPVSTTQWLKRTGTAVGSNDQAAKKLRRSDYEDDDGSSEAAYASSAEDPGYVVSYGTPDMNFVKDWAAALGASEDEDNTCTAARVETAS